MARRDVDQEASYLSALGGLEVIAKHIEMPAPLHIAVLDDVPHVLTEVLMTPLRPLLRYRLPQRMRLAQCHR